MATFAALKTDISDLLLDPSNTAVSVATVAAAINNAISYWKFRRFWFNSAYDGVTLTPQSSIIPIPSNFLVEMPMNDGFAINYSNSFYPLVKKNPREFDDIYLDNSYGMPRCYTLRAGVYSCYPIPDQAYTIKRWYLKDYTDLSADGDNNDFTNYATQLITYWAASKLFAERRQDEKMSDYYTARAMDEYENLKVRNEKANGTGDITIHSFL
jgi:hypothetical protein